ncbi:flotillin-like protein FloA [Rubritalea marina]|uniref:flotillin-like protein FloA n=1 Tax=Rubritalea marina TaxID=361055 RepID=UPI0006843275|nr:flotillin-like protein FloA [Rubritalea marina]
MILSNKLALLAGDEPDIISVIIAIIAIFASLVFIYIILKFFKTWLRALLSRAPVAFSSLIGMWLRKVPFELVVDSRVTAVKAGLGYDTDELEAHYLAGGDISNVVLALIAADKAGINLNFKRACAIDLATKDTGKTVLEAVRTSINPKVIDCPSPTTGQTKITAVAKDGIAVNARARVTVRTNLERFVGGATEETIIARVGEGIVTAVGSAASYKEVLENPDSISRLVLTKGVDSSTAFEILSIDIADVDVSDNIGARLQAEQAEADKQIAQARAEVRRAAAVAAEQEMSAKTQEMKAKVVEAEAEIPMAIAEAFRNGNLGIMEYAKYQNINSDTKMRDNLAKDEE